MTETTTILPGVPGHRWNITGGHADLVDAAGNLVLSGTIHSKPPTLREALADCVLALNLAIDCIGDRSIISDLSAAANKARAALGE